jgi:hypothetical protein
MTRNYNNNNYTTAGGAEGGALNTKTLHLSGWVDSVGIEERLSMGMMD